MLFDYGLCTMVVQGRPMSDVHAFVPFSQSTYMFIILRVESYILICETVTL